MRFVIVIGSNCGNRIAYIETALSCISFLSSIQKASGIYESPDCMGSNRRYLNKVVEIETTEYSEYDLVEKFKELEKKCGRDSKAKERGEVCLDIDIVIANGEIRRPLDFKASYFQKGYKEILTI